MTFDTGRAAPLYKDSCLSEDREPSQLEIPPHVFIEVAHLACAVDNSRSRNSNTPGPKYRESCRRRAFFHQVMNVRRSLHRTRTSTARTSPGTPRGSTGWGSGCASFPP